MKMIWIRCSSCGVLFDREEGRRGRFLSCPQCRVKLQETALIKRECPLCGRLTLTTDGNCPWCMDEADETPTEEQNTYTETYTCQVLYAQKGRGSLVLELACQRTEPVPYDRELDMLLEKRICEAVCTVLSDVCYDCRNVNEMRALFAAQRNQDELLRMIQEEMPYYLEDGLAQLTKADMNTLRIIRLEVSSNA